MNKPNRNNFRVTIKTRKTARLAALFVLAIAILTILVAIVRGQCGPHDYPIPIRRQDARPFWAQLARPFQARADTCRPAYGFPQHQQPHNRTATTTAKKSIVLVDNVQRTAIGTTRRHSITGWICARNEVWTYVATAAHLITDGVGDLRVNVDGAQHAAEIAGVDHTWDTLVLAIARTDRQPLTTATSKPPIGTTVDVVGRTSGANRGRVARYVAPGNDPLKYEMIDVAGALARAGDSGGPIFNTAGHVVGIISGSDANYTTGAATPRLTQILQRIVTEHWSAARQGSIDAAAAKPTVQPNQPPVQPPIRPQNPPPPIAAKLTQENLDRIATQIHAKMTADPEPFRGRAGRDGPRGPAAEPPAQSPRPPKVYWDIIPRN